MAPAKYPFSQEHCRGWIHIPNVYFASPNLSKIMNQIPSRIKPSHFITNKHSSITPKSLFLSLKHVRPFGLYHQLFSLKKPFCRLDRVLNTWIP